MSGLLPYSRDSCTVLRPVCPTGLAHCSADSAPSPGGAEVQPPPAHPKPAHLTNQEEGTAGDRDSWIPSLATSTIMARRLL